MKKRSSYWQLLPYLQSQWITLGKALACTMGFALISPLLAWLAGRVATLIGRGDVAAIAQLVMASAAIFLIRGVVQYGQDTLIAQAALKIALHLRQRVYAHLHKLDLLYFETTQTGDLSYRLTEDVDRIGEVVNKVFHQLIPNVLQLAAVLTYMIYLNWQLTLTTLIIAPLMGLLIGWFGERLLAFSRRSQNQASNLSALLTEVLSGVRLVQAFAAEDYEVKRFAQEAEYNRGIKYRTEQIKAVQVFVVGFLEAISLLLLFWLGGWQISRGNLQPSEFVSFIAAVVLLIDPIAQVTSNYSEFKQGQASTDRVFELLHLQSRIIEKPKAMSLPAITGKVEYRHVSFAYHSGQPVLQRLSLLALPGEVIALVGPSGAGKTTLVNLLPRFYDPQSGQILIDDIDIQGVALKSLRQQIGIVPQETVLFSGTIAQNIAFGQTQFDLTAVEGAAKIANAHQFICQFTNGYQTRLGERGVNLSGGQRQRLAIARAVLLNPRILILDEATSALDSESEALVQEALERLMLGRTVFIIAHRLATVHRADRILVLEQGRVVESGTHAELMTCENGTSRYARFYAQQFPA